MKKGLAVVYDPHNLYQFIWYYCNKGKAKKWDALCLPNGYKGEYMHTYCESAGIFQHVYRGETDYSVLSLSKKFKLFCQMAIYFLIGKREKKCKDIINQYVNESEYDEFVVIADVGVVSGACVALGKEREVVILEDGFPDYEERTTRLPISRIKSIYMWQGFFLSVMGYCSPGWFWFKPDLYCVKYSSHPSNMRYKNYREIRQLYDRSGTDNELFDSILKKVYPSLSRYDFDNTDILLMTRPLDDFTSNTETVETCKRRMEEHIQRCGYKEILLKRHPREKSGYQFGEDVHVIEIDSTIPAEVLLPFFTGKDALTIMITASMLCMETYGINCTVMVPKSIYDSGAQTNGFVKLFSRKEIDEFCNKYLGNHYNIIEV